MFQMLFWFYFDDFIISTQNISWIIPRFFLFFGLIFFPHKIWDFLSRMKFILKKFQKPKGSQNTFEINLSAGNSWEMKKKYETHRTRCYRIEYILACLRHFTWCCLWTKLSLRFMCFLIKILFNGTLVTC